MTNKKMSERKRLRRQLKQLIGCDNDVLNLILDHACIVYEDIIAPFPPAVLMTTYSTDATNVLTLSPVLYFTLDCGDGYRVIRSKWYSGRLPECTTVFSDAKRKVEFMLCFQCGSKLSQRNLVPEWTIDGYQCYLCDKCTKKYYASQKINSNG
jgi:hypothetical protein